MKRILALAALAFLTACASTPELIVGPSTDAAGTPVQPSPLAGLASGQIAVDLQSAAFNLDNAIAIGALPANDPADKCIHGVLQQAGIEVPPGGVPAKTFVPKNDGVVSLGAVAYIMAQQAKLAPGITVPMDCKTLIGTFVIDGFGAANKLVPGILVRGF